MVMFIKYIPGLKLLIRSVYAMDSIKAKQPTSRN